MQMPSNEVHEVLAEKGISEIHHANSVLTACQFLRRGALLSRGSIERAKLHQTKQVSDIIDRKFSLWFDVFTDSVDIHSRASRANAYGPVLFVLDSAIMKEESNCSIWVTKLNPTKWDGVPHEERWFTSTKDLRANFVKGRFDQMIVFRHNGGELPFKSYLKQIILDDPEYVTPSKVDLYSLAGGALLLAKTEGAIEVQIKKRKCKMGCKCLASYKANRPNMSDMFLPIKCN